MKFVLVFFSLVFCSPAFSGEKEDAHPSSVEINSVYQKLGQLEASLNRIGKDVDEYKDKASEAREKAEDVNQTFGYILALILAFWIAAYEYMRRRINKKTQDISITLINNATKRIREEQEEALEEYKNEISAKSSEILSQIEDKHFQYMQVTSLGFSGHYDEALEYAGWRGDFHSFQPEPSAYQRTLITCLSRSKNARNDDSHLIAWRWARVLLENEVSFSNMMAMLRTGITLKQFSETMQLYDKYASQLCAEEQDKCEPILFVAIRRSRKPSNNKELTIRLKQLTNKHQDTKDVKFTTNMAAFYRDEGRFEDADRLMKYNVNRLTGSSVFEDGWERLFNTYIANSIDQGKPSDAVDQAKTLIAQSKRTDHIFTCARLAWELKKGAPERDVLLHIVENRYKDGFMPDRDDGTVKTLAVLREVGGDTNGSEQILEDAISRVDEKGGSWFENQSYYYKSILAQMYLSRNEESEVNKAIELLVDVAANDDVGEAHFYMAKAYALSSNPDGMKKHLELAIKARRKWIIKASHTEEFKQYPEVDQLLSEHVSGA